MFTKSYWILAFQPAPVLKHFRRMRGGKPGAQVLALANLTHLRHGTKYVWRQLASRDYAVPLTRCLASVPRIGKVASRLSVSAFAEANYGNPSFAPCTRGMITSAADAGMVELARTSSTLTISKRGQSIQTHGWIWKT